MKTLNLFAPDEIAPGVFPGMSDRGFLEREIAAWLASKERRVQLDGEAYYDGRQAILDRKRTVIGERGGRTVVDNLPNNRIVDNQFAKMVDQKANYLLGRPVTFDAKNAAFGEALTKIFGKKVQRTLRLAAEKALIGGKAWLCPYLTDGGELAFALFPAHEVLPFWADDAHTELDAAVHLFPVTEYKEGGKTEVVWKAEIFHGGGVGRFLWRNGALVPDPDAQSGPYLTAADPATGEVRAFNWTRVPLVCFKYNHRETPLLCRVRCLQDALNLLLSDFMNGMAEDVHSTVLVLHNYDGENLGEFRHNLATYGAVKVRDFDGSRGAVDTLRIEVNSENYRTVIDLIRKAIVENARGFDAKDERLVGTPNQMNIRSMYADVDLDANGMETEFQAAFEDLMFFVKAYLANSGAGDFDGEDAAVIFNRDILVNESESIDDCMKSVGLISRETLVKQHPWVDDPDEELKRLKAEEAEAQASADPYRAAFGQDEEDLNEKL